MIQDFKAIQKHYIQNTILGKTQNYKKINKIKDFWLFLKQHIVELILNF